MSDAASLIHDATNATTTMKDNAIESVQDATQTAKDALSKTADSARSTTDDIVSKNPLILGLGAVAVGFLAGLVVPISAFERENLGPVGGRLTDRAKDSASELVARGKTAVADAVSAALKPSTH